MDCFPLAQHVHRTLCIASQSFDAGQVEERLVFVGLDADNGRETKRAPRTSATVEKPADCKTVAVPLEKLKEYVGTYVLNPNFEIAITLEGEQLMAQATMQAKLPIFAESETMFFLKMVEAQIEFVRETDGKVTSLILHQNGHHQKGVRK